MYVSMDGCGFASILPVPHPAKDKKESHLGQIIDSYFHDLDLPGWASIFLLCGLNDLARHILLCYAAGREPYIIIGRKDTIIYTSVYTKRFLGWE